jgi:hypothetical protein
MDAFCNPSQRELADKTKSWPEKNKPLKFATNMSFWTTECSLGVQIDGRLYFFLNKGSLV